MTSLIICRSSVGDVLRGRSDIVHTVMTSFNRRHLAIHRRSPQFGILFTDVCGEGLLGRFHIRLLLSCHFNSISAFQVDKNAFPSKIKIMSADSYAHHFSIANIPFGIASSSTHPAPAAVTRIRDHVIFLDALVEDGVFRNTKGLPRNVLQQVCRTLGRLSLFTY
jgi:hypothetical protein